MALRPGGPSVRRRRRTPGTYTGPLLSVGRIGGLGIVREQVVGCGECAICKTSAVRMVRKGRGSAPG